MSMQPDQRREYQQQAGVTEEQIRETIGDPDSGQVAIDQSALADDEAAQIQRDVKQVVADAAIIAAKYNKIARETDRNPVQAVGQDELEADRAILERIIADEYRFQNPFGNVEGKRRTIDVILSGRILYDGFGRGGFETTEEVLQIHGDTAVAVGMFTMRGAGQARRTRTGEIFEARLDGAYRTSHTYVRKGGQWQLAASQMTEVPAERDFVFVADEDEGAY